MQYNLYKILVWYGQKTIELSFYAYDVQGALADIEQGYGKPDLYQITMVG